MKNNIFAISDIHLDHLYNHNQEMIPYLLTKMYDRPEEHIIIAGDIGTMDHENTITFLALIGEYSQRYNKKTFYVLGNHDYYYNNGLDVAKYIRETPELFHESMIFLGDHLEKAKENFVDGNSHIIGGESWFDTSRGMENFWRMSDASVIHKSFETITNKYTNFLKHTDNIDKHSIVVTHHIPVNKCVSINYKGSILNHYYVSDLEEVVEKKQPAIWVFGHTHEYIRKRIGNTLFFCNPLGYPMEYFGNFYDHIDEVCARGVIK